MTIRKFTAANGVEHSIDSSRMSTGKQRYAVACRFWNEFQRDEMGIPETASATAKTMIGRIKNSISAYHDMKVTDGDIHKYFNVDKIPAGIKKLIKVDGLEKQAIADGLEVKKVSAKTKPKISKSKIAKHAKRTQPKVSAKVTPKKDDAVELDGGLDAVLALCRGRFSAAQVAKALKEDDADFNCF